MSMNWAGCLNHNLHHNPSEKPRESPTTATDCETQNLARHKKYVGFTTQKTTLGVAKNTLVITTQKTTLVHSFVEHYAAI